MHTNSKVTSDGFGKFTVPTRFVPSDSAGNTAAAEVNAKPFKPFKPILKIRISFCLK